MVMIMGFKEYFDPELKATIAFSIIGIIVGYVSFIIRNSMISLAVAIAVMAASYFVLNSKIKKDTKWWLSNGVVVYVFLWILVWSIFYTMNFYSTLA